MSFITDTSTQLNNLTLTSTFTTTYTTSTSPDINFNVTSGIYNPSQNVIKIFTNNTDALTIDSNQCLYGNATGLTHLQCTNIDNKPSYFPADYNSTVINTPNLSVYTINTDLNSLSTNSVLSICNLNATSTTIYKLFKFIIKSIIFFN